MLRHTCHNDNEGNEDDEKKDISKFETKNGACFGRHPDPLLPGSGSSL